MLALLAGWQSGYAAACKAVDAGSIPTPASNLSVVAPDFPVQFTRANLSAVHARVVKLVDTTDLKSVARVKPAYRFDSGSGHQPTGEDAFSAPPEAPSK